MFGFVSGSYAVRVRFASCSCPLRVWFVSGFVPGLVSGFAFGSRLGSCLVCVRFMSGSCLVRVWFVPGSCPVWSGFVFSSCLVRVWFVFDRLLLAFGFVPGFELFWKLRSSLFAILVLFLSGSCLVLVSCRVRV